jgi:HK97 family phage portal protein
MTLLARIANLFGSKSAAEGAYRPGPYLLPDGWLSAKAGQYANWWQMGYDPLPAGISSMVEACVSAYAQTVAMCPLVHWERLDNGGREQVTTSALSRIAIAPNDYQTRSDFLMNLVRSLYLDGNAYALALRNNRFEISSLHGMNPRMCRAQAFNGEIYYELGGNSVVDGLIASYDLDPDMLRAVPARDVLHVKLNSICDVLHGETPLAAAGLAVAANNAILTQSISFFANQSRPSGILSTDLKLDKSKMDELRRLWDEKSVGLNAGSVPILQAGLKFQPIAIPAKDTQAVEALKLNDAQIAQVFRVPLAIVGSEQQPMGSTEALMNFWIAGGLGFALDRVELAFDKLFGLPANEYSELDSSVLLRSNLKDKIEAFARGTIGGIYSPNEARAEFELPKAKAGDEPRVQQQVVPLSFAAEPPAPPTLPASSQPSAAPGAAEEDQQADVAALVRHNARLGRIDAMLSH